MLTKSNRHNYAHGGMPIIIGVSLLLFGLLILSIMVAVTIGSVDISVSEVYKIIIYKTFGIGDPASFQKGMTTDIVWFLRLPRLLLAMAVGTILALSGVVMQAIVKNPLADPYILGVSSGASLGATLAIMLGLGAAFGNQSIGVLAFIGAFSVSILVVGLANTGGQSTSSRLILSGMALSAMCSAISSFIIFIKDDAEGMRDIEYWLMGSVAGANWSTVATVVFISLLLLVFFMSQYRTLNLMLLGDDVSITLGKNLHKYRTAYLLLVAIGVGFAVYASGMIGFVGLIIPHIIRMFVGSDHRKVLILSALLGSIFLVWADVACRIIISGSELPIGILTSLIGGPFFVYLIAKKSYGFGVKS